MALSKKDKLLQAAQKNIQKGQWLKAAKDFQKVVELDPKDIRSRQRLGELLNRGGQTSAALEAYEVVGKHYADNGFYLKAIAVYKQMQKIDPSQGKIYARLGQLNEKQGLIGNALGEYRQLADLYETAGNVGDLHEVLEKMKELDPQNSGLRLRLCRSYLKNNLSDKAGSELQESLTLLEQLQDADATLKFSDLVQFYLADDLESKIRIGRILLLCQQAESARDLLEAEMQAHPESRDAVAALAVAYRQLNDHKREQDLYEALLAEDGDHIDYQEGFVRACLDSGNPRLALDRLEGWKENFIAQQRFEGLREFYEQFQSLCDDDERVRQTLHQVYENTGEGSKLFDLLSKDDSPPAPTADAAVKPSGSDAAFETPDVAEEWFGDDLLTDGDSATAAVESSPLPTDNPKDGASKPAETDPVEAPVSEPDLEIETFDPQAQLGEPDDVLEESASFDADDQGLELEIELDLGSLDGSDEDADFGALPEAAVFEEDDGDEPGAETQTVFDADALDFGRMDGAEEVQSTAPDVEEATDGPGEPAPVDTEPEPAGGEDLLAGLEEELGEVFDMGDLDLGEDDAPDLASDLEETEFYLQQNFLEEALQKCQALLEAHPDSAEVRTLLQEVEERLSETKPPAEPQPASQGAATPVVQAEQPAGASKDQNRLEVNLSAFKKGIEDAVALDDCETHFNLGIAYKEMGLFDEAMDEFEKAMGHPDRAVDALTLTGMCLVNKGAFEEAAELFKQGLQQDKLTEADRLNLYFELGQLYLAWARPLEALDSFQQVADTDISYRDVGDQIRRLRKELGLDSGSNDDGEGGGPAGASGTNRVSYL